MEGMDFSRQRPLTEKSPDKNIFTQINVKTYGMEDQTDAQKASTSAHFRTKSRNGRFGRKYNYDAPSPLQ